MVGLLRVRPATGTAPGSPGVSAVASLQRLRDDDTSLSPARSPGCSNEGRVVSRSALARSTLRRWMCSGESTPSRGQGRYSKLSLKIASGSMTSNSKRPASLPTRKRAVR